MLLFRYQVYWQVCGPEPMKRWVPVVYSMLGRLGVP